MKNQLGRIGVLMGGTSSEREISLKSGKGVSEALQKAGCDVIAIDLTTTDAAIIIKQLREARVEIVFLVLHGKFGEDGTIQTILEKEGIPYTGSGPAASRLAMDKSATQRLLQKNGISIPDFGILENNDSKEALKILDRIGGCPVVVKPAKEGSSIGITVVHRKEEYLSAIDCAAGYGFPILIEKYIAGREITSGILGTEPLALIEIRPRSGHEFFDFTAKYQKGLSDYLVPAEIDQEQTKMIQGISKKVFELTGCRDLARSDFILAPNGKAYFLEINTIPGFTEMSLLPKAARHGGISFEELCVKLAGFAAGRLKAASRSTLVKKEN